jgi:hypothetical protein
MGSDHLEHDVADPAVLKKLQAELSALEVTCARLEEELAVVRQKDARTTHNEVLPPRLEAEKMKKTVLGRAGSIKNILREREAKASASPDRIHVQPTKKRDSWTDEDEAAAAVATIRNQDTVLENKADEDKEQEQRKDEQDVPVELAESQAQEQKPATTDLVGSGETPPPSGFKVWKSDVEAKKKRKRLFRLS